MTRTDRKPHIFPIANIDVNHIYYILISQKYEVPRTLDRNHRQTTTGGTKWADLFFKNFNATTVDVRCLRMCVRFIIYLSTCSETHRQPNAPMHDPRNSPKNHREL